jgi:hypothetical protein
LERDRYEKEQEEIQSDAGHKEAAAKSNFHKHEVFARGRNHVPNRDCHRGDFGAYKEMQVLDGELTFWRRRLRLSRPRRDCKVGAIEPPGAIAVNRPYQVFFANFLPRFP